MLEIEVAQIEVGQVLAREVDRRPAVGFGQELAHRVGSQIGAAGKRWGAEREHDRHDPVQKKPFHRTARC